MRNGGQPVAAQRRPVAFPRASWTSSLPYRKHSDGRVELLQPLEFMRVITASVRTGDEHLPALVEQGIGLGDCHSAAQAHRRGDILALGCVDNEGHNGTGRPVAMRCRHRASFVPWDVPKDLPKAIRRGESMHPRYPSAAVASTRRAIQRAGRRHLYFAPMKQVSSRSGFHILFFYLLCITLAG